MGSVELGFVEKVENWTLFCHFFPSKVGGKPAWLHLKNLPNIEELTCPDCQNPCIFLLQIYCPLSDKTSCFHRTLFIFACKTPSCCGSSKYRVMRSQLPKINEFYSDRLPIESDFDINSEYPSPDKFQNLCSVCGCSGNKRCSKCHRIYYCSKHHQTLDWKAEHKSTCGISVNKSDLLKNEDQRKSILFPEWDLVTETEELESKEEKSEEEKIAEYENMVKRLDKNDVPDNTTNKDLEEMATSEGKEDKIFQRFKDRINLDPDQVLRYELGGKPLLVSDENKPVPTNIPPCQCGQPRRFEFQVMPQLLNHLDVDRMGQSLDWGTLLVYTCSDSCDPPPDQPYVREFLWKQDFSNVDSAK